MKNIISIFMQLKKCIKDFVFQIFKRIWERIKYSKIFKFKLIFKIQRWIYFFVNPNKPFLTGFPVHKKYGNLNYNKKVYIYYPIFYQGFGAFIYNMLARANYHIKNGDVFYIDTTIGNGNFGDKNLFDEIFVQPNIEEDDDVTKFREEIYHSRNVFLINRYSPDYTYPTDEKLKLKFRNAFIEYCNKLIDKFDIENTLACFVRGTDYVTLKPKDHEIQPSIEQLFNKIDEFVIKHSNIKKIFLITEDSEYKKFFEQKYHNFVYYNENVDIKYDKTNILDCKYQYFESIDNKNLIANHLDSNKMSLIQKEYMRDIYVMSKCGYFVGGIAAGTKLATVFGTDYIDEYVFNLGKY